MNLFTAKTKSAVEQLVEWPADHFADPKRLAELHAWADTFGTVPPVAASTSERSKLPLLLFTGLATVVLLLGVKLVVIAAQRR